MVGGWKRRKGKLLLISILGRDKLEFTGHALEQMKVRQITEAQVIRAIEAPTRRGLRTQPGRNRVRRKKSTYHAIDVVYEEYLDRIVVVTAISVELPRPTQSKAKGKRQR